MSEVVWVTGDCWLYCRRTGLSVMWVGTAQTVSMYAPLYACEQCLVELAAMIWQHTRQRDLSALQGGPWHLPQLCPSRERAPDGTPRSNRARTLEGWRPDGATPGAQQLSGGRR
jgi:hypothetical protein